MWLGAARQNFRFAWHYSVMSDQGDTAGDDDTTPPLYTRIGNRALEVAEVVVYAGIAILLSITAIALLVKAAWSVPTLLTDRSADTAIDVLDTLLLVFIVVELLFAVRVIIARRELLAEPFLLAGIIASIKEIIVLSVKAADTVGRGTTFSDQMWEIGVLGALVLVLGLTAYLLRRKEREPGESANNDTTGDPESKVSR